MPAKALLEVTHNDHHGFVVTYCTIGDMLAGSSQPVHVGMLRTLAYFSAFKSTIKGSLIGLAWS